MSSAMSPSTAPSNPSANPSEWLIEARELNTYYGASHILRGIDFHVGRGETIGLMGRNGMGKSTLLKSLMGLVKPRGGEVRIKGQAMTGASPFRVAQQGIAYVPEGRGIFGNLSVKENLIMAARAGTQGQRDWTYERVLDTFPRLKERESQAAGTMSGGEQQMLAIGRALMAQPKVLLLDEPSMGLAPILVEQIFDIITEINSRGTAVLLVEQNAMMALGIAKRGYILQIGEVTLEDSCAKLAKNPKVREAYLGV